MPHLTVVDPKSQPKPPSFSFSSSSQRRSRSYTVPQSKSETVVPATVILPVIIPSVHASSFDTNNPASFFFSETAFPQTKSLLSNHVIPAPTPTVNPTASQAQYVNQVLLSGAPAGPTLASKLIILADKSLKRLVPIEMSLEGTPRVLIPDEVFSRGAKEHKDFIMGSFLGKLPTKGQIQSIVNYMWGKGKHLEVRLNPLARTILVRIPNEFIRNKVLDHKIWHIGSSMFHVAQLSPTTRDSVLVLKNVLLWAHVIGIPFDLMAKKGLCYVADLIGEPIH